MRKALRFVWGWVLTFTFFAAATSASCISPKVVQVIVPATQQLAEYPSAKENDGATIAVPQSASDEADAFQIIRGLLQKDDRNGKENAADAGDAQASAQDDSPNAQGGEAIASSPYCPECLGIGHCRSCSGSGKIISIFREESDMLSVCADCNGNGCCAACQGTGRTRPD